MQELKIKNIIVEINSIGDSQCRPYYKKLLVRYLKSHEKGLCSDCRRRIRENPLRVLDCKEEKCQRIIKGAPQIIDSLCEECHNHFKEVLEFLDEVGIPYRLNPYLVRGLDYYTKTVFEIVEESEEGKRLGAIGGGGRFDSLIKLLGGRETPACGMAGGIERIIALMKTKEIKIASSSRPHVFLAQIGQLPKRKALALIEQFRRANIRVGESLGKDSLKSQLRIADKIGVDYTVILGQKEALEGTAIVKDMKTGKQEIIKLNPVI